MKYLKGTVYLISGALSAVYLSNIGAGIIEFIPDNIPVVGNLDEIIATIILLRSAAFFGLKHPLLANAEKRLLAPKGTELP
jgi:hypothetical protein